MSERKITENLAKLGSPEEREFDRKFWRDAGHEARFAAAWAMVVESYLIQGKDPSELRLQRTVESMHRRKR